MKVTLLPPGRAGENAHCFSAEPGCAQTYAMITSLLCVYCGSEPHLDRGLSSV